jgi:hypothetical protein
MLIEGVLDSVRKLRQTYRKGGPRSPTKIVVEVGFECKS